MSIQYTVLGFEPTTFGPLDQGSHPCLLLGIIFELFSKKLLNEASPIPGKGTGGVFHRFVQLTSSEKT